MKTDRVTATLHEDQYTFMNISRSILLIKRDVSDKICRENKKHTFVLNDLFFEILSFYELMWENIVEPYRPQTTVWRMLIA